MKLQNAAEIIAGKAGAALATPGAAGATGDYLTRVQAVIKEFKGLLLMGKELQGLTRGKGAPNSQPGAAAASPAPAQNDRLALFVEALRQAGYGDKPIGELIKEISPYTLNQVLEVAKRVRLE